MNTRLLGVGVIVWTQYRPQSFWRCIMEILGLLAHTVLTMIREAAFYAPLARSFITYNAH